jgi:hypothetical protein
MEAAVTVGCIVTPWSLTVNEGGGGWTIRTPWLGLSSCQNRWPTPGSGNDLRIGRNERRLSKISPLLLKSARISERAFSWSPPAQQHRHRHHVAALWRPDGLHHGGCMVRDDDKRDGLATVRAITLRAHPHRQSSLQQEGMAGRLIETATDFRPGPGHLARRRTV